MKTSVHTWMKQYLHIFLPKSIKPQSELTTSKLCDCAMYERATRLQTVKATSFATCAGLITLFDHMVSYGAYQSIVQIEFFVK